MSLATYRKFIRANFRGAWLGVYNYDDFIANMSSTIRLGLRDAFQEGMKKAGVPEYAISPEERLKRENIIFNEINRVGNVAAWLEQNTKEAGTKLAVILYRADGWLARWSETYELGYQLGLKDEPLEWFLGATEKHCHDCSNYAGRVYRASVWEKHDIRPKSTRLSCFGIHCDCRLGKTDKPLNRGYPPRPTGKG